jgi:hypothetical protein
VPSYLLIRMQPVIGPQPISWPLIGRRTACGFIASYQDAACDCSPAKEAASDWLADCVPLEGESQAESSSMIPGTRLTEVDRAVLSSDGRPPLAAAGGWPLSTTCCCCCCCWWTLSARLANARRWPDSCSSSSFCFQ